MRTNQRQKTPFGGSVAGSLSEPLPGSSVSVGSVAIMRDFPAAVRP